MKKLFLLFLSVGAFVGCSKDDSNSNQNGENCNVIEWKSFYNEGDGFYDGGTKKIYYDNQNRVSKVESFYDGDSFTTTYNYSDNMIIVSSPIQKVVYTLNSYNLIEKYDIEGYNSVKIGYNSANQMTSAQRSGSKLYTFNYSGGNLINATEGDENFSFTYDTAQSFPSFGTFGLDPFYHLFGDTDYEACHVLYEQGYFGVKIKNAIKTYNGNYTTRIYNYSYSNGKLSSYGQQNEKYDLIYSCK